MACDTGAMRKRIAGTVAILATFLTAASFAAPAAHAGIDWCPVGSPTPAGGVCLHVYHYAAPSIYVPNGVLPGDGNATNVSSPNEHTYLHMGDAAYYVAYRYYAGTAASFQNWSRANLGLPAGPNTYSQATQWNTRLADGRVDFWIHHYYPAGRTYAWWHVTVSGSDASMVVTGIPHNGTGNY